MAKQKKTEAVGILGIPPDFGDVLASLGGGSPTNGGRLQVADGGKVSDITPIAQKANGGGSTNLGTSGTAGAFNNNVAGNIDPSKLEIGQLVEGKGIYVGQWEPTGSKGRSLGKTFDLYAAPKDISEGFSIRLQMSFKDAVRHVAGLQNWHGHDGGNFKNEEAVMKAVRNNPEALGNWFIPTKEMLHGCNANDDIVQKDNLYAHREKMPFGSEFLSKYKGDDEAYWYCSCTEDLNESSLVHVVEFTGGLSIRERKKDDDYYGELFTRPVRAELRSS